MINQTLQPDDTAIGRLRIRGPASAGNRITRDLNRVTPPRTKGESWVFLRKLEARGSSSNISEKILHQMQHTLTLADQGHCDENLVRFNNLTELLAALLIDLASGRAAGRWYWQRWSHLFSQSRGAATVSLMAEHWDLLNAVAAQLARQRALLDVWQSIDPVNAERLIGELARHHGIALSRGHFETERGSPEPLAGFRIGDRLIDRWRPICDRFQAGDTRRQLAILLLGQEAVPLMLQQTPERTIALIDRCFDRPRPVPVEADDHRPAHPASTTEPPVSGASGAPEGSTIRPEGETSPPSTSDPSRTGHRHEAPTPDVNLEIQGTRPTSDFSPHAAFDKTPAPQASSPKAGQAAEKAAHKNTQRPTPPSHPGSPAFTSRPLKRLTVTPQAPNPDLGSIHTAEGGVFYLLNFLNRSEVQALMGERWQELPNGWGWLYRLARTLRFNEEDPLSEFFAHQLDLDSIQQLNQLPPLPAETELTELALRWYGKTRIWSPSLLHLQARMDFSPSHIDLTTPMHNVRMEIRLAGLDINPGWLPWLGRVVQFHYETEPT